ncbi:MAG: MFS transporter [Chloroflexota bacterium]
MLQQQLSWLGQLINRPYPVNGTNETQRRGMHLVWWDTIWSAASSAFYGDFLVLYMVALGASAVSIGTRSSINSTASLIAPLLGAWLVERYGRRKLWVVWGAGGVARAMLALAAAIPLLLSGTSAVNALVGLLALQAFAGNISQPAWRSLFGDIVPLPIRGRFMGLRMMASNVLVVAIVPIAGWMIRQVGGLGGYQLSLLGAAILGLVATSCYARIPEPETDRVSTGMGPAVHRGGMGAGLAAFRRDRIFVVFCLVNFFFNLGIQLSGPFFSVHMVQNLGFTVDTVAMVTTVSTVVNIIAMRVAGPLVDRHGTARITAISMLLVPLMPLAWVFAQTPFHVILVRSYGFIAWAGFHVAEIPLLLRLTPSDHREQFLAYYATINSVSAVVGPLIASWLYANYGFSVNLLASAAGRGLGGLLFLLLYLKSDIRKVDKITDPAG